MPAPYPQTPSYAPDLCTYLQSGVSLGYIIAQPTTGYIAAHLNTPVACVRHQRVMYAPVCVGWS